jgi:NTP pyrophosphatase (non-canonical NTP hydrolase)
MDFTISMCPRCGDGECCGTNPHTGACYGGCDETGSHAVLTPGQTMGGIRLAFDDLRDANVTRCEQNFHPCDDWSPSDWMTAAAGEMGEAANLIKKRRRGEDIETKQIAYELADTVIYLDLLAARLGIDLGAAVQEKFNIVSDRVGSEVRL